MRKSERLPRVEAGNFTEQLKAKDRRHRDRLSRLQKATTSCHPTRNDIRPPLTLVELPINALHMPHRKVRALNESHTQEIARAMGALGFCVPILIGKDNRVIDGQSRVEAARRNGLSHVPCVRVDHLSESEQSLLSLAVNRLGEKGRWDLDELKIEFEDMILSEAPIEITGFTLDEIDQVLAADQFSELEPGPLAPEAGVPALTRLGDVILLGPHRLVCGDATDPQVWHQLMDGSVGARCLITDEPYNVAIEGHVSRSGHREFAMASGEMSDQEFASFNAAWIDCALPWLRDGAIVGTFIDWRGYPTVHAASIRAGLTALNLIVWGKTNAGMGSLYRSQYELLPLFKKGTAPHVNNVELGKRGRWRSNLWTYPGASSLGSDARKGLKDHPTVKPVAMIEDALLDLTNRGDMVIDPFAGSGSTLIACQTKGRVCRALELDPLYVDLIVRRFEAKTGIAAVSAETGERFDGYARARGDFAED